MDIEFKRCPKCAGYGILDNGTNCRTCGGHGKHGNSAGCFGSGEIMFDKSTGRRITTREFCKLMRKSVRRNRTVPATFDREPGAMMAKKKNSMSKDQMKISAEVKRLNEKTRSVLALQKFMYGVQVDRLDKAEALRAAAKRLVKSQWQHRCSNRVGGCTAVSQSALDEFEDALKACPKFHMPAKSKRAHEKLLKMN